MMSEIEEAPAIRCCEPFAVFHADIHAVVFTVEISSAGWLRARAVRKGWVEDASQFLDENGPFGKGTGLEVNVQVFLLDIDVVIFGEAGLAVVEAIGCQRCTDEGPVAIAFGQSQFPFRIKHYRRLWGGCRDEARAARQRTYSKYAQSQNQNHDDFSHDAISFETISKLIPAAHRCSLRGENRISLHVNPIGSPRGDVAPEAIFLVVGCNLLVGSVGFVQGPTPAVAP